MKNIILEINGLEEINQEELINIDGGILPMIAAGIGAYVGLVMLADYAGQIAGDRWNS